MYFIGIDIGSTASKVVCMGEEEFRFVLPTGWSSKETASVIQNYLAEKGVDVNSDKVRTVATGYGRISVEYADFVITEITCHARGGKVFAGDDFTIIDVGGQDTKIIRVTHGMVEDFLMNDKCSAGTGKFLEVMANRLDVTIHGLFNLAEQGEELPISSLCTVFAETEIVNYMGEGHKKEDIAAGVVGSVASKVAQLAGRMELHEKIIMTGGISDSTYFAKILSEKLRHPVETTDGGRYAGALGAACLAREKKIR